MELVLLVILCSRILYLGGKVRVFRSSDKLLEMKKRYKDIEIMVGDVTDKLSGEET